MIVLIPKDSEQKETVTCVLCGRPTTLLEATAGLLYADGRQAFAHNAHIQGRAEWFVGWALFAARERHKLLEQGIAPQYMDEWAQ